MIRKTLSTLWAAWKRVVDWVFPNSKYIIAALALILWLMTSFGILAPEEATSYRNFVLALFGIGAL